jgi:hypothetical protein
MESIMTSVKAQPKGQSLAQVTKDWWRWSVDLDRNGGANPFEDTTGAYASAGHMPDSHMFYLAGIAGNTGTAIDGVTTQSRAFEVPANDAILVPVINTAETVPDYEAYLGKSKVPTIDKVEQYIYDWKNSYVQDKFLLVDGKPVPLDNSYVESGPFSLGSVEPGDVGYDLFGLRPAGTEQQPAFAGGYWGVIKGLGVGTHSIEFGGSIDYSLTDAGFGPPDGTVDFSYKVVDTVTVVPPSHYHPGHHHPNVTPCGMGLFDR